MDDRIIEDEWFGSWWVQRCFFALQLIERHWDLTVHIFIGRCLSAVWKNLLKFCSGQTILPSFLLKNVVADFPYYLSAKLHDDAIFNRRCFISGLEETAENFFRTEHSSFFSP